VANIGIEIRGIKELRAKLKRMDTSLQADLVKAMTQATALVQREAARYPAPSRRPMRFVSDKQRRYVMMLVSQGRVPYRRTGTLGRTLTSQVKSIGNDIIGTVGTNIVYAPWVIGHESVGGRGPQARYHRGTWKTLKMHLDAKRGEIRELFKAMVRRWISKK